jgi:uncharacterized protein (TIGR00269 family)
VGSLKCSICKNNAVVYLSYARRFLCRRHFTHYVEKRAKRTIREFGMIEGARRIGIAVSGGKDSLTTLYILNKIAKEAKIELIAIAVDEGIKGYRDKLIKDAERFCKEIGVPLKVYSFKEELGITMDEIVKKKRREKSCTYCGVFRRWILNKAAQELKLDKLAVGHNLDDVVQSFLMNLTRNEPFRLARFGEESGLIEDEKFIARIRPLMRIPEKEIALYAVLNGIKEEFFGCPYVEESFRHVIRNFLNDLEDRNPGTKFNLYQSYSLIRSLLVEKYGDKTEKIAYCAICGEPSSKEICRKCELLKGLKE